MPAHTHLLSLFVCYEHFPEESPQAKAKVIKQYSEYIREQDVLKWQTQYKRIQLHIMASKTVWKQMSGKWFYLDSVSSSRRISKYFSKTRLNTDGQEAGLSSWDVCSPLLPQRICLGDSTSGSLTLPRHTQGKHQTWLAVLLARGKPCPGSGAVGGQQHTPPSPQAGGCSKAWTQPSPRVLHLIGALVHPPRAQGPSHSTNHAIRKMQLKNPTYYIMYL